MKKLFVAVGMVTSQLLSAETGSSITVPWKEFEQLYSRSVAEKYESRLSSAESEATNEYTLTNADYEFEVKDSYALVEARLSGTIAGQRTNINTIFGRSVVVKKAVVHSGVMLRTTEQGLAVCPAVPMPAEFSVTLHLIVPISKDENSRYITLPVPLSVSHSLTFTMGSKFVLRDSKEIIEGEKGSYYSATPSQIMVRFDDRENLQKPSAALVNTFSQLTYKEGELRMVTYFEPRTTGIPFTITLPEKSVFLDCSLSPSQFEKRSDKIVVSAEGASTKGFCIETLTAQHAESFRVTFPTIAESQAPARFMVLEEDGWIVRVDSKQKARYSDVPTVFKQDGADQKSRSYIANADGVDVSVKQLESVEQPNEVVELVTIEQQFDETGRTMTVLSFTLKQFNQRYFKLRGISDGKVWYVKVNDKKCKLFVGEDMQWQIPVSSSDENRIEIAYAGTSDGLDISGVIKGALPALGFSANRLVYTVVLPKRLELVSFDAPLAEYPTANRKKGSYSFSTSFYTGEALSASIYYKETIED